MDRKQSVASQWRAAIVPRVVASGVMASGILMAMSMAVWSAPAWAADDDATERSLYRSRAADGSPVFSDRPPADGSEVLERRAPPEPVNVMPARPRAPSAQPATRPQGVPDAAAVAEYTLLEISSPEHEATIRHPTEPVPVSYRIEPGLQPGHRVQLLLNGVPQETMALDWPDRGEHRLMVQVVGPEGQTLKRSDSVTVFVHRPSVLLRPGAKKEGGGKD
ncbi:hypothetical protein K8B33_09190 [Alcanivorax sp. JB21]|uniref:hypothetical protein n=1 Tax=Alcanivorax limicola TaxID=2874102 RepID=UPI001CBBD53F|nr:hypothetical protein [Alcanivorax limicola]MBZ2189270.1 hypothetical protein [Alcanivorax limicola]